MSDNPTLSATLTVAEWNTVLAQLAEGRYSAVSLILQNLVAQLQAQQKPNGADQVQGMQP